MSDIVERLRGVDHQSIEDCSLQSPLFNHAADEIERLRALLSEAEQREKDARRVALEEAAKVAEGLLNFADPLDKDMQGVKKRHQPWLDDVAANISALQSEER